MADESEAMPDGVEVVRARDDSLRNRAGCCVRSYRNLCPPSTHAGLVADPRSFAKLLSPFPSSWPENVRMLPHSASFFHQPPLMLAGGPFRRGRPSDLGQSLESSDSQFALVDSLLMMHACSLLLQTRQLLSQAVSCRYLDDVDRRRCHNGRRATPVRTG